MKKVFWIFCLLTFLVLGQIQSVHAKDDPGGTHPTLVGIPGVTVLVYTDYDDPQLEQVGLGALQFKADIEMKLSMARIPYAASEKEAIEQGWPLLQVTIMAKQARSVAGYAVAVYVEILQPVSLPNNPEAGILLAPTWSSAYSIGFLQPNEIHLLRDITKTEVLKFIDIYHQVNKKSKKKDSENKEPEEK